jgi:hypothetical protein
MLFVTGFYTEMTLSTGINYTQCPLERLCTKINCETCDGSYLREGVQISRVPRRPVIEFSKVAPHVCVLSSAIGLRHPFGA